MEIYNATGVVKTPILRVTKSIGALVFVVDLAYASIANEKITAHIERSNGSNEEIATNISLSAFMASSVFGEGKIITSATKTTVMCEIGNVGSIPLGENESIVITLDGLDALKTYEIHGIEMPIQAIERIFLTEKVFLNGQKNRTYEVIAFDEAVIIGAFDKLRLTYPTDEGSQIVEYSYLEIRAISADIGLLRAGSISQITNTALSLVGVSDLEIFANNQVNLVLRDVNKI
ncbi:hypothetical protein [Changchengzhania lutea]|uniref:hypothetical protein n=1 Tax=Changchengzhania lutea TaxID=2049305 RepID=UPI00115F4510|nr:hypothetical protein [Changchengzhania lutea]